MCALEKRKPNGKKETAAIESALPESCAGEREKRRGKESAGENESAMLCLSHQREQTSEHTALFYRFASLPNKTEPARLAVLPDCGMMTFVDYLIEKKEKNIYCIRRHFIVY